MYFPNINYSYEDCIKDIKKLKKLNEEADKLRPLKETDLDSYYKKLEELDNEYKKLLENRILKFMYDLVINNEFDIDSLIRSLLSEELYQTSVDIDNNEYYHKLIDKLKENLDVIFYWENKLKEWTEDFFKKRKDIEITHGESIYDPDYILEFMKTHIPQIKRSSTT